MNECGGCRDLGAHVRWCPEVVGYRASRIGTMSDELNAMGDFIGSSNTFRANKCYDLAEHLKDEAAFEAKKFQVSGQGGRTRNG